VTRSGGRRSDSHAIIGDQLAWTLHTTSVGFACDYCGCDAPPGADYWICHGANAGRVCVLCFLLIFDPTPWSTSPRWETA